MANLISAYAVVTVQYETMKVTEYLNTWPSRSHPKPRAVKSVQWLCWCRC